MKIVFYLFICMAFVFSNEYKISKIVDKDNFIIKTKNNINPNKTVFILSAQNHISALGQITKKEGNAYHITILEKSPFKNKNIPYLKYKLDKKDKVIDKLFDNNAMIISPDFKNYQKIKNKFNDKNFISPDLLIAFTNGETDITKKQFSNFAKQYHCSYYYFVFSDGIYIKDAFSLKTIRIIKQNINYKSNKHQFFNNIQESYSSLGFSLRSDKFDDYYKNIAR